MLTDRPSVISAACAIVDEEGEDGLTIAAVAERVGVSPSGVYHHVGDAGGLRDAIAAASLRDLATEVTDAVVGLAGGDALVAAAETWRGWAASYPARYALATATEAGGDEAVEASRELIGLLARVLERSGRDDAAAVHGARYVRSSIHGFVLLEIGNGFVLDEDVDASFGELCNQLRALADGTAATD